MSKSKLYYSNNWEDDFPTNKKGGKIKINPRDKSKEKAKTIALKKKRKEKYAFLTEMESAQDD